MSNPFSTNNGATLTPPSGSSTNPFATSIAKTNTDNVKSTQDTTESTQNVVPTTTKNPFATNLPTRPINSLPSFNFPTIEKPVTEPVQPKTTQPTSIWDHITNTTKDFFNSPAIQNIKNNGLKNLFGLQKPMEFPVADTSTIKQTINPLGEPFNSNDLSFNDATRLFHLYSDQEYYKQQGITPKTNISPELMRVVMEKLQGPIIGSAGGDIVPGNLAGGRVANATLEQFAKETNPETISNVLQKSFKVPQQTADEISIPLSKAKTVNEVKDVLLNTHIPTGPVETPNIQKSFPIQGEPTNPFSTNRQSIPKSGQIIDNTLTPQEIMANAEKNASRFGKTPIPSTPAVNPADKNIVTPQGKITEPLISSTNMADKNYSDLALQHKNATNEVATLNKKILENSQRGNLVTSESGQQKLTTERNVLESKFTTAEQNSKDIGNKQIDYHGEKFTVSDLNKPADGTIFTSPLKQGEFFPIKKYENGTIRAVEKNTGQLIDIPPLNTSSFYSEGWKFSRNHSFDGKNVSDVLDTFSPKIKEFYTLKNDVIKQALDARKERLIQDGYIKPEKNKLIPRKKTQFSNNKIRELTPTENEGLAKIRAVLSGKTQRESIANIPSFVSQDGKIRPLIFDKNIVQKIQSIHGVINPENLLINANDWDAVLKNVKSHDGKIVYENKINLIKKIPNTDKVIIIGADRQNGFFILTHYEISPETGNEVKSLLGRGDLLSPDGHPLEPKDFLTNPPAQGSFEGVLGNGDNKSIPERQVMSSFEPTPKEFLQVQPEPKVPEKAPLETTSTKIPQKMPIIPKKETSNIGQLRRMLDREQQSLAHAQANPEQHLKAYGENRIPKYQERIANLKARIEAIQPKTPTLIPKRIKVPNAEIKLPDNLTKEQITLEQKKSYLKQELTDHPGRKLEQIVNRKEGEILDRANIEKYQETDPKKYAKLKANEIQRNRIARSALEGTKWENTYDSPDTQREVLADYKAKQQELRDVYKDIRVLNREILPKKDEIALNKLAEREQTKSETDAIKKQREESKKQAFDEGMKNAMEKEKARSQKSEDIYKAKTLLPQKLTFIQKIKSALFPAKYLESETKAIFMKWERGLTQARNLANKEVGKLKEIPKGIKGFQTMLDYEVGKPTPYTNKIRNTFDALFQEAKARGLEVEHIPNYLPHVYLETPKEINIKIRKYLTEEKGMSENDVNAYMEGAKLNPSEARRLSLNPFFIKERTFPTYEVAMQYGLTPKYTHPDQLVAYYREQMEKTLANRDFINALMDKNKILTVEDAPNSWKAVELPFSYKGYYAESRLAKVLNQIFSDPAERSVGDIILGTSAKLSRTLQEITLSGGVPYTNINFYSIGQAIKDMTAGKFNSGTAWVRANFTAPSIRFFRENQGIMNKMADHGIDLSSNISNYQRMYKNIIANDNRPFLKKWFSIAGEEFNKSFNEKTFNSYMPQVQIQLFKSIYKKAISDGLPEDVASKLAAETTKAFYGLVEKQGRAKLTDNALSSVFFAPRFREGIVNTLFNTGKSFTSDIKNPNFRFNRHLFIGMVLTYGLYNVLNYKLNGNFMWNNPSGRESALRIPGKDGNVTYIEFMPSFLSFARNMFSGGIAIAKGDIGTAEQKFGTLASMPIQILTEVMVNKDYFGNPIYKATDPNSVQIKKIAQYIGLAVNHPYVQQAIKIVQGKTSLYHALVAAFEIPLKFGSTNQESQTAFYNAIDAKAKENAKALSDMQPTYDKLQEMRANGQTVEANKIYFALSKEDKVIYNKIKASDTRRNTISNESKVYSIFDQAQKLKADGKTKEANDLYSSLSLTEKKAYQKLKARFK